MDEQNKDRNLEPFREDSAGRKLTTNQGVRIEDNHNSLKAGERGPTLMEDFIFREKLTHFDHERIPERVVHARGSGAHGYFQLYESMAEYTKAKFLQDPAVKTPVFVRFSTVVGSRGSADTVRDVRGFATKFFTEDGNYDLVGNNMPIFFIQDAIKFPDLVHSIKPEPHHEIPQASAAHDTFWDFASLLPEITHMLLWVLSDRALPRSYRMMEGFGVNTFRFVNAQGKSRFVKFHWKPLLGMHSLVWDEVQKLAGKDPDYNRRDLWEAIEMGDFPEYEFGVQIIEAEQEHDFDFDILDPTKFWPEELIPVKRIGKMTLNRNPDNFFAETEQVAFHPGHVVPGIDFSNDPLLQGRLFSYLDTQLLRVGPNFAELPINRPLSPVHNNQRDGHMRQTINQGRTSYEPNSLGGNDPQPSTMEEGGYRSYAEKIDARKVRGRSEKFNDHFRQATLFLNSLSAAEKKHLISACHFELGKVEEMEVRRRMVALFNQVDGEFARQVAAGIGVEPPAEPGGTGVSASSPAVSMENTVKDTVKSRRVAILAADGYDHRQLASIKTALKEAGATAKVVSKVLGSLKSQDGQEMAVDKSYLTTTSVEYDAIFVPGGLQSIETMMNQGDAIHFLNEAFKHCKAIAATGEGVELLRHASLKGVRLADTGEEGSVVDKGVVTVLGEADLGEVARQFIQAVAQHRHWDRDQQDEVPA